MTSTPPSVAINVRRCEAALSEYAACDAFTNLVFLLADAMHYCDFTGQDFHIALAQACRHYLGELNNDPAEVR